MAASSYKVFCVLRTAFKWKVLPPEFRSDDSAHLYFQLLMHSCIFRDLLDDTMERYDYGCSLSGRAAARVFLTRPELEKLPDLLGFSP